jgi:hypothetical protein
LSRSIAARASMGAVAVSRLAGMDIDILPVKIEFVATVCADLAEIQPVLSFTFGM